MQHFSPASGQEFNFFTEKLPDWKGWLATLVIDNQGKYLGVDGTSKSIGNHTDLQLLLALRSKASVIVTTGATARAESYKPSRFAPIAVITRDPESLAGLPLIENPGAHGTILLSSTDEGPDAFTEFDASLNSSGFKSLLFEGGPKTLDWLLASNLPVTLVLSIANLASNELSTPSEDALRDLLSRVLPDNKLDLMDAYSVGPNLVSVWSSPKH